VSFLVQCRNTVSKAKIVRPKTRRRGGRSGGSNPDVTLATHSRVMILDGPPYSLDLGELPPSTGPTSSRAYMTRNSSQSAAID
jgi:hypothetical protein